jgi:tetratricopeptide (TPR) repeat protein
MLFSSRACSQVLFLAATLVTLTTTFTLAQVQAAQQPVQASQTTANPTTEQGLSALRASQPQEALDIFEQVLRADPDDAAVNLLAASAAVELYKGDLAVQYAEKAHQLDPQSWKVHTTLVVAYAQAGKKDQRDAERATLHKLHNDPHAPDAMQTSGFLLDLFPVKQYRVEAVEYFQPVGKLHIYYRFVIRNSTGKQVWLIDAESNDFDQDSWAKAHPQEAAAGNRQFQLVGTGSDSSTDYGMFSGNADYDKIRAQVTTIIQSQSTAFSKN